MECEPGPGWADAVSKILRMGKNNPESNRILSKAKKDATDSDQEANTDSENEELTLKPKIDPRKRPNPQEDALLDNELKSIATRGVVHLFNAVKTVNSKSDRKKKKKKKKKKKGRNMRPKRRN